MKHPTAGVNGTRPTCSPARTAVNASARSCIVGAGRSRPSSTYRSSMRPRYLTAPVDDDGCFRRDDSLDALDERLVRSIPSASMVPCDPNARMCSRIAPASSAGFGYTSRNAPPFAANAAHDAPHLRRIAIRDRAVGGREDEDTLAFVPGAVANASTPAPPIDRLHAHLRSAPAERRRQKETDKRRPQNHCSRQR